jgi:hypothetical protein
MLVVTLHEALGIVVLIVAIVCIGGWVAYEKAAAWVRRRRNK